MRFKPRRYNIPFSLSAMYASAFASLSLLISTMTTLMWVAMSDPWILWRAGSIPGTWWVSMWCLCHGRSSSASGAVGCGRAKYDLSSPVFRVRAT